MSTVFPILNGGHSDDFFEIPIEAPQRIKAAIISRLQNTTIGIFQKITRLVDPITIHVIGKRNAGLLLEKTGKVHVVVGNVCRKSLQ